MPGAGASVLPLPSLLSQVLVAFTIELDNEFEHELPHRTSAGPVSGGGPWLVSFVMWANVMRLVGADGVHVRELPLLACSTKEGVQISLAGLTRWSYVVVEPDPADSRPKPPRGDWLVVPTADGRKAQDVWRALPAAIEERWTTRFGAAAMGELRESLQAVVGQLDVELPRYLPLLRHGLRAEIGEPPRPATPSRERLDLSVLLSRALLAFTLDVERETGLSLAASENVLRVLANGALRVRDLPRAAGVSKEAINVALGLLAKQGLVAIEAEPAGRGKSVRLTAKGREAEQAQRELVGTIEARWRSRFGEAVIRDLRLALERLVDGPLLSGLEPYPDGWRASVRRPATLPHHPMVLHRGGYPDGS